MVLPQNKKPQLTYGQKIVRVDFAANDDVSKAKQDFADLIDKVKEWNPESGSMSYEDTMTMLGHKARAMSDLECACMYMVKAMTTKMDPLPENFLGHGQPE